jgi:phospholipid-translocating ATPase
MSTGKGGLVAWYNKLAAFKVESLFARRKVLGPPRTVFVNENLPSDYFDEKKRPRKQHIYVTNQVITSKYTVITFLPRNLLEQFRRIANVSVVSICSIPCSVF